MYTIRRWSVRNARFLEWLYGIFEPVVAALHPLYVWLGYARVEAPMARVERVVKGFLFDCRMCGHCVLGQTGMSCPMNCPKQLRNGPCGGVRADGKCEVIPDMPCVWVEAWEGSRRMRGGSSISTVQPAVDFSHAGSSSWLRRARERAGETAS